VKSIITDTKYPPLGSGVPRTTGEDVIHLTDVIRYIEYRLNNQYKGDWGADMHLTMDVGFLWEHALEMAYADRMAWRPGEIHYDGIVGSPDGVGYDYDIYNEKGDRVWTGTDELILEEYKATWKSTKHTPLDNFNYMTQIKSYCKMLDIGINVCVMRIVYLVGDYKVKLNPQPMYRICRFEFTQGELDTNWAMILKYKDQLLDDKEWWATRQEENNE